MANLSFDERPILVFWESTKSCLLACRHCRAEAMADPLPGQLSTDEGFHMIESLAHFGRPYPVLIITGGDVLMRPDVFDLVEHASDLGIPVGLAPSVTQNLNPESIQRMRASGVRVVSISLDAATAGVHEGIRGVSGHFEQTVDALRQLVEAGIAVQVNTVVMQDNVGELPGIAKILNDVGVHTWELFFLVSVGRGRAVGELSPDECNDVLHFLYDCSEYDIKVRTVEAPYFRPVISQRRAAGRDDQSPPSRVELAKQFHLGDLYMSLASSLEEKLGLPRTPSRAETSRTRDGKGIVFVAHNGDVYPSGFLPVALGNVRERDLADIYRESPLLKDIRRAAFRGRCGVCDERDLCGGSRARSYAAYEDALASDPLCPYAMTGDAM